MNKLDKAYKRYIESVTSPSLSENDRRIDLKHMRYWYPYYAEVVEAIANNKKPKAERRNLTEINAQSQIDYQHINNAQILHDLDRAQNILLKNLPRILMNALIPYRKSTKYSPERYADTLVHHLRMHREYLDKLRKK